MRLALNWTTINKVVTIHGLRKLFFLYFNRKEARAVGVTIHVFTESVHNYNDYFLTNLCEKTCDNTNGGYFTLALRSSKYGVL